MLLVLACAGCEDRPAQPVSLQVERPGEHPPRALPGTYRLGPDNLLLDAPGPETPVVWVDLEVVGGKVSCRPWRPDEQEVTCELASWVNDELNLNLVRRYEVDREEQVERWFFRGGVTSLEAERRELVGNLTVEFEPARSPMNYRVRSPRVEVDQDELVSMAEKWTRAAEQRSRAELEAMRNRQPQDEGPPAASAYEVAPAEGDKR